jgi:hypothetical protein
MARAIRRKIQRSIIMQARFLWLYNGIASASRRGFDDFSCSNVIFRLGFGQNLKNHDCGLVAEKRFISNPFIPIRAGDQ